MEGMISIHPDPPGRITVPEIRRPDNGRTGMPVAKTRFEAGMSLLRAQNTVDAKQIAAIGYCFGGGVVLNMARMGEDLKGVASFHGPLGTATPAQAGTLKARIISFTGEDDPMIGADKVAAFKQEMAAAQANYQVVTYSGVKHSFTNPDADELGKKFNLPLAYSPAADKDSWQQTTVFLDEIFNRK